MSKKVVQLRNWYNDKVRRDKCGFDDFSQFNDWYSSQVRVCHYCGLEEDLCNKIVMNGILTSKRFPKGGVVGRGTNRGVWLEVDRKNPEKPYSLENCVLACYFCNNDKSDVFDEQQYKEFIKDRVGFLKKLISPKE